MPMANYMIKWGKMKVEVVQAKGHTIHGGLVAVAAVMKKVGLVELLRAAKCLDKRRAKNSGFHPEVMGVQIIMGHCGIGGTSLADAERIGEDAGLRRLLGVKKMADQTQLGVWLREIGREGADELAAIGREVAARCLKLCGAAARGAGGEAEVFFDDTQIELHGRKFEGAAYNYNKEMALGWQCMFVGPFLVEQRLGPGNEPVSSRLEGFMADACGFWKGSPNYFYADSGSSEGKYLDAVKAGFSRWSAAILIMEMCGCEIAPKGRFNTARGNALGLSRKNI